MRLVRSEGHRQRWHSLRMQVKPLGSNQRGPKLTHLRKRLLKCLLIQVGNGWIIKDKNVISLDIEAANREIRGASQEFYRLSVFLLNEDLIVGKTMKMPCLYMGDAC